MSETADPTVPPHLARLRQSIAEGEQAMADGTPMVTIDDVAQAGDVSNLKDALAAAEAELDPLTEQTRAAYRAWRNVSDRQRAVAEEIRELKRQIREEHSHG